MSFTLTPASAQPFQPIQENPQEILRLRLRPQPLHERVAALLAEIKSSSIFTKQASDFAEEQAAELEALSQIEDYLIEGSSKKALAITIVRVIQSAIERLDKTGEFSLELLEWENSLMALLQEAMPEGKSAEKCIEFYKIAEIRLPRVALGRMAIQEHTEKKCEGLYAEANQAVEVIQSGMDDTYDAADSILQGRMAFLKSLKTDRLELSAGLDAVQQRLIEAEHKAGKVVERLKANRQTQIKVCTDGIEVLKKGL